MDHNYCYSNGKGQHMTLDYLFHLKDVVDVTISNSGSTRLSYSCPCLDFVSHVSE